MLAKIKQKEVSKLLYLINKPPNWNDTVGAYVLNVNGRVTMASVKNFQLVQPDHLDEILLQFGRVGKDEFTMDFRAPLSPFQVTRTQTLKCNPRWTSTRCSRRRRRSPSACLRSTPS